MGDDDGGPSRACLFEGGADLLLYQGVERGGGFVEQEEPGTLQKGAGDREALAFSAGERQAAFTDDGTVVAGQTGDEFIDLCGARSFADGAGIIIAARIVDVAADAVVPEKQFLGRRGQSDLAVRSEIVLAGRSHPAQWSRTGACRSP